MSSPSNWAALEDFGTLFLYFWHRDFPLGPETAVGARRADWTIHIGIAVRNIATLMGFVTRFERGQRKDAVLRSTAGDEIAIEWEWKDVWGNELELATTPDIAVDDSKQLHRPLQDLQAEEMLGIFTISRSPNVIFTKSIQLTSSLEKRKPYISPYGLLPDEEE